MKRLFETLYEWAKIIQPLAIVLGTFIVAGLYAYDFYTEHTNISKDTEKIINPPTSKAEDLREVSEQLAVVINDLNTLKQAVDKKSAVNTSRIMFGINDAELAKWELSVSGKNTLHLVRGDRVLVVNTLNKQQPSAQLVVKFVRENVEGNRSEMYINRASADFFSIENPEVRGVFELTVQKIP